MYNTFKNQFISNIGVSNINLNEDQINKILNSMDRTANNYNIYKKEINNNFVKNHNNIPKILYKYLDCKISEGLSYQTVYGYKIILENFFKNCLKNINEIESEDIRCFLIEYQKINNVSNRTLNKYREFILRFFNWLHGNGIITKNPGFMCKPIHYEYQERQSLTTYELEILRNACLTPREQAILEMLYSTACRVSELIVLKFSDIDWNNMTIHIFGKGSKHRTSFINARARVALENYMKVRKGESPFIFVSERYPYDKVTKETIEHILHKIADRCKGAITKNVTPHIIRHTTANNALHNGMTINEISQLLGHENIETTMIYAKTSYDDIKLAHNKYIV